MFCIRRIMSFVYSDGASRLTVHASRAVRPTSTWSRPCATPSISAAATSSEVISSPVVLRCVPAERSVSVMPPATKVGCTIVTEIPCCSSSGRIAVNNAVTACLAAT